MAATPASASSSAAPIANAAAGDAEGSAADAGATDAGPSASPRHPLVLAEVLALRPDERSCVVARGSRGGFTEVAFEDAQGNLRRMAYVDDDEKGVASMKVLRYDERGNVVRVDTIDASGNTTHSQEFEFDAQGVLQRFHDSDGFQHRVGYGKAARTGEVFVRAERLPWRWIRDRLVDESFDQLPTTGWVTIVDRPDKTSYVKELLYDKHGRLQRQQVYLGGAVVRGAPPSTDTTFVRDARGRILEARIQSSEVSSRFRETYTWQRANLVRLSVGGMSPTVRKMKYDAAGRLIRAQLELEGSVASETTFVHECPQPKP